MHTVKCVQCGEYFDRDIIPAVKVKNRYAHAKCRPQGMDIVTPDNILAPKEILTAKEAKTDTESEVRQAIVLYMHTLYGDECNHGMLGRQLNNMHNNDGYSYENILKTIRWYFEVKRADPNSRFSYGSLGFVPYFYNEAMRYYNRIEEAQRKNEAKTALSQEVIVYTIASPQVKTKIKLFNQGDD